MPPSDNFEEVSLGTGAMKVDGATVGLLQGNSVFRHNYDELDFKAGQPLVLYGSATKEIICEIECDYAQMNPRNFGLSLGGLEPIKSDGTTPTVIAPETPQLHTFRPLIGQDGQWGIKLDGVNLSSVVVKQGATTLVADTDFTVNTQTGWLYWHADLASEDLDCTDNPVVSVSYSHIVPKGQELPLGKFQKRLTNHHIEFAHIRSGDGTVMLFEFHRGQASGTMEITLSPDNWNVNKFIFKSIRDLTKPNSPLGRIRWIDPT